MSVDTFKHVRYIGEHWCNVGVCYSWRSFSLTQRLDVRCQAVGQQNPIPPVAQQPIRESALYGYHQNSGELVDYALVDWDSGPDCCGWRVVQQLDPWDPRDRQIISPLSHHPELCLVSFSIDAIRWLFYRYQYQATCIESLVFISWLPACLAFPQEACQHPNNRHKHALASRWLQGNCVSGYVLVSAQCSFATEQDANLEGLWALVRMASR